VAFNYFRVQVAPGMNQLKWKTTAVDPSRYGARENCGPANTVRWGGGTRIGHAGR
jgi:hypothetical protein